MCPQLKILLQMCTVLLRSDRCWCWWCLLAMFSREIWLFTCLALFTKLDPTNQTGDAFIGRYSSCVNPKLQYFCRKHAGIHHPLLWLSTDQDGLWEWYSMRAQLWRGWRRRNIRRSWPRNSTRKEGFEFWLMYICQSDIHTNKIIKLDQKDRLWALIDDLHLKWYTNNK